MRTFEGLLTPAEAREADAERDWLAIEKGTLVEFIVAWEFDRRVWEDQSNPGDWNDDELLGLCPLPWEPLPARFAPIGVTVWLLTRDGQKTYGDRDEHGDGFCVGDEGRCYGDDEVTGWLPVVTAKEVPDAS